MENSLLSYLRQFSNIFNAQVALWYHFTCRALLRHGITLWIDLPLQMIAEEFAEDRSQHPVFDISTSGSYSEVINGFSCWTWMWFSTYFLTSFNPILENYKLVLFSNVKIYFGLEIAIYKFMNLNNYFISFQQFSENSSKIFWKFKTSRFSFMVLTFTFLVALI